MDDLSTFLSELQTLIEQSRFVDLESDTIEMKPCPSTGQDWSERFKSVCAFSNTRGGFLILGIREEGRGQEKKYVVSGYDPSSEPQLKELRHGFTDSNYDSIDLTEYLPPPEIRQFMDKRIAVQRIDVVPADKRFIFYKKL